MEIIKQGNNKYEESFEKQCWRCAAIFTYTHIEVEMDRDGTYILCPCCNAFIAV